ncbi:MAG: DUF3592 domain-containing protein [Acidobacteria bacterium]|nr:DUF3592 domain-containing protein [Acidobacteriota bacterium]
MSAAGPVESITGSASSQRGPKNIGRIVFGIFLLFGLGFMIPFGFMFWGLIDSSNWEETRCTVTSSEVGVHSGSDGSTYSIDIRYRYEWNGEEYSGDRYHFSSFGSSSGYQGKADVVERYPVGSETPCWVDPNDPEKSVLARKVGWEALFVLLPLVFVVIGLLGVLGSFGAIGKKLHTQRRADWLPGSDDEEQAPPTSALERERFMPNSTETGSDPNVLEAKTSPKGRFIGSLFAAILWNGIVWPIIYFAIIAGDEREGCLIVFMGIFALVGLVILLSVPYYALALANPRITMRLGGPLVLGGSTSLAWSFNGKADRIRKLIVKLEGREEARYRRGTNTHTDRSTFFEHVIIEQTNNLAIASGQATIDVPEGTMHSFDGANNRIVWLLSVQGDVPRWPDVSEEFELTVRPKGMV